MPLSSLSFLDVYESNQRSETFSFVAKMLRQKKLDCSESERGSCLDRVFNFKLDSFD